MRCPRCGNENSEENRFCGMCGAKLSPTPVEVASAPAQGTAMRASTTAAAPSPTPVRPQAASSPRPLPPPPEEVPAISGPSFLGLSDPAPRNRSNLNSDSHGRSGNLDYLLDDEEPRRGGAGKFFLILLALALAVGFGYLRWKNQGLPWLHASPNKPPAAAENSDSTDTSSTASQTGNSTTTPTPVAPAPATPQPAAQAPAQPAPDAPAANASPAGSQSTPPDAGNAPANTQPPTGAAAAASDAPNSSPSPSATTEPAAKEPSAEPAAAAPDTSPPPAPAPKPKKPAASTAPKPHAGVAPTPAADPVSEAQKYIYGRGASQDCERGMRLLKPAAAQANPKAMIEMGALYSAGLCTPHDLPTAYRWFAMALRKQPDNSAVQADLQKLWGEMTQPERQLAIKLSQ